jgi:hypothetical protein
MINKKGILLCFDDLLSNRNSVGSCVLFFNVPTSFLLNHSYIIYISQMYHGYSIEGASVADLST